MCIYLKGTLMNLKLLPLFFCTCSALLSKSIEKAPPPPPTPYFETEVMKPRGEFHVQGEFLYWKFANVGMPYAIKFVPIAVPPPLFVITTDDHTLYVPFNLDPGFRVGIGYILPYGEWDIDPNWTSVHGESNDSATGNGISERLQPLWDTSGQINTLAAVEAQARVKVDFDAVDVMLGRFFLFGSFFAVKPSFGFRAAWIDQDQKMVFRGRTNLNNPALTVVNLQNHFQGAGLRTGVELRMVLKQGWEFYATTFGSLLYGTFDLAQAQQFFVLDQPTFNDTSPNTLQLMVHAFELGAGLKWGSYFWRQRCYLSLKVGYEQQNWMNFNHANVLPVISVQSNYGDLGMHGLVAGGKLFF